MARKVAQETTVRRPSAVEAALFAQTIPGPQSASESTREGKGGLTRGDFFAAVVERLRATLPDALATFRVKTTPQLVKIYYGNERVHFEAWANSSRGTLEIGLHFEDGPISTAAYLAHFDRFIVELKHDLGPSVELERWTSTWGHLYEVLPLTTLDRALVERTAGRLRAMIAALQPLVETAAIAPERSSLSAEPRGPWRAWRRGGR